MKFIACLLIAAAMFCAGWVQVPFWPAILIITLSGFAGWISGGRR